MTKALKPIQNVAQSSVLCQQNLKGDIVLVIRLKNTQSIEKKNVPFQFFSKHWQNYIFNTVLPDKSPVYSNLSCFSHSVRLKSITMERKSCIKFTPVRKQNKEPWEKLFSHSRTLTTIMFHANTVQLNSSQTNSAGAELPDVDENCVANRLTLWINRIKCFKRLVR